MKKYLIIILGCLVVIASFIICKSQTRSDLEEAVIACKEYYEPSWKLASATEEIEEKRILIVFEYSYESYDKKISCILNTQKALAELVLGENSKWKNYTIDIRFEHVAERFVLSNVSSSQENLTVGATEMRVSLKTISEWIPDAKELIFQDSIEYESIEEIQGFTDLRKIQFIPTLTDEEKEYIWSIFPECVIQ